MPDDDGRWIEVDDVDRTWRFDAAFLRSGWTCTWGAGCLGILPEPAPELGQGCCSVGAHLLDDDEARTIAALVAVLEPEHFQHHAAAEAEGALVLGDQPATRVVDGACIFLNRPGFDGGEGCALHLAALADGERPMDWKPSICWQAPLKVDREAHADGRERATLRPWTRRDWVPEGAAPSEGMAWCCTEGELAFVGERPVVETLADEIVELVGRDVYVEVRRRLGGG